MLTWGALHVVGGSHESREDLATTQKLALDDVAAKFDALKVEADGSGWQAKVFLYCIEVRCPQCGWRVPLLPSLVISTGYRVIAELLPDVQNHRYEICIRSGATDAELQTAELGTVRSERRGDDPALIHAVDNAEHRIKISTLRGDYRKPDGTNGNRLRLWEREDIRPRPDDLFQERLYAVQWQRSKNTGKGSDYQFRAVTEADLERERLVEDYVAAHLDEWQKRGFVPDMRIEPGAKTDEPIRTRGWTYWHHLFNPRQLLIAGLLNQYGDARLKFGLTQVLNTNSRLSRWKPSGGGGGIVIGVFDNQALNTLLNYGCRGSAYALGLANMHVKTFPLEPGLATTVKCLPASESAAAADIYITDPPYGDAVNYEEILEFFIAWLRKTPPKEFADWIWDSRRALAIKGDGEGFPAGHGGFVFDTHR